jgi:hypothetical protein
MAIFLICSGYLTRHLVLETFTAELPLSTASLLLPGLKQLPVPSEKEI